MHTHTHIHAHPSKVQPINGHLDTVTLLGLRIPRSIARLRLQTIPSIHLVLDPMQTLSLSATNPDSPAPWIGAFFYAELVECVWHGMLKCSWNLHLGECFSAFLHDDRYVALGSDLQAERLTSV